MFRYLIVLFLILLTDFSFGQIVLTQTHSDATIGLDRKAFNGLGNTSQSSDGYAHDFTLPARTNPCQQITGIRVDINLTGYTNIGGCSHPTLYYNLFYGCSPYTGVPPSGGASCLNATNLIAEPNFPPGIGSPVQFNFGSPLGSPLSPNIVPDFGDNLSVDIIPVSNPGCYPVINGRISYQYTITVTVTVTDLTPTIPTFTQVPGICSGDTLSALPITSNNGITGTWAPALNNTATTTYTFTPVAGQCATSQTMTIAVNTSVTPTFTQVPGICSGDTLSALPITSNNGITGTWAPALNNTATTTYTFTPVVGQCATSQTMTIAVNTSVTPTFTQVPGICSGDTLSALPITSNNGITGTWAPALNNTATTTYTFTPVAGQCATSQTMTIAVNTSVTPTFTQVPGICSGDTLSALPITSNNGITGTWAPALNNTATTTYTFTPVAGQCATSQTMTIAVNTSVTPTLECWETATFNPTTCSWDISGTQPIAPTGLQCWQTTTFNTITCVWDIIGTQPGSVYSEDLVYCNGATLTLQANTNLLNPTYLWSTGETADFITVNSPDTYAVEITSPTCFFETRIFNVTQAAIPNIDNVTSEGRNIVVTTSNSGDFLYSLNGNIYQPSNTFLNIKGGLYTIYVRERNCPEIDTKTHLHFFVPKYFTPNNDGVNDTFSLSGIEFYAASEVSIFNRYGKLVKFSQNGPFSWDGTFNSAQLPSDDYWYVIIIDGQKLTGHFALKR